MVPKFISCMRGMFNSHRQILTEIALMLSFPSAKHWGVTHVLSSAKEYSGAKHRSLTLFYNSSDCSSMYLLIDSLVNPGPIDLMKYPATQISPPQFIPLRNLYFLKSCLVDILLRIC